MFHRSRTPLWSSGQDEALFPIHLCASVGWYAIAGSPHTGCVPLRGGVPNWPGISLIWPRIPELENVRWTRIRIGFNGFLFYSVDLNREIPLVIYFGEILFQALCPQILKPENKTFRILDDF